MRHQIIADETMRDRNQAIVHLERLLYEALQIAAAAGNADAERVHLWRIDASANEISDTRREFGGGPREMSEQAIACLDEAGEHHIGVVIRAGDRRLSVKATSDGYRVTVSLLPLQVTASGSKTEQTASAATTSDATKAPQPVPASPRPPGLSSGVPANVLPETNTLTGI